MGLQFEHKPAAVRDIYGYPSGKVSELIKNGGSTVDDDWYFAKGFGGRGRKKEAGMTMGFLTLTSALRNFIAPLFVSLPLFFHFRQRGISISLRAPLTAESCNRMIF
jgi:hypothetical protein